MLMKYIHKWHLYLIIIDPARRQFATNFVISQRIVYTTLSCEVSRMIMYFNILCHHPPCGFIRKVFPSPMTNFGTFKILYLKPVSIC